MRVGILGALAQHGELKPSELADLLDVDRATLRQNLHALEDLGVVVGSRPRSARGPGRVVAYGLVERRARDLLVSLERHIGV